MQSPPRRTAFTLVELLVAVGIIALLVGVLLPTLSAARKSAQRVQTISAARSMVGGYTQHFTEKKGSLLWGYTPPTVNGQPIRAYDRVSGHTFGFPVPDRYPWRLAPYVEDLWDLIHLHSAKPERPAAQDSYEVAFNKAYSLSLDPTFGINSVYLGGHAGNVFKGFVGPTNRPNTGKHVAFRAAEVKNPARQIVFAESRLRNFPAGEIDQHGEEAGFHYVIPPRASGQKWAVDEAGEFQILHGMAMGLPMGRHGEGAAVGFFDGHAELKTPRELDDMTYWSTRATSADYDFVP